jgi:hypothetical protein
VRSLRLRIGLLISLLLLTVTTYIAPVAQAYMYNLVLDQEYYTRNMNPNRGWLFVSGGATPYDGLTPDWATVDITVDSFINAVRIRLYDGSSFINRSRASVLMNMMLGYDSTASIFNGPAAQRWQNGITVAQANWNTWEGIVRAYDARGWVEWNVDILGCQGDIDGFGAAADPFDVVHRPDVTFSAIARPGCGFGKSVRFHVNGSATSVFRITDMCANLTGEQTPLADFSIQTNIQSGAPPTPGAGGNVSIGVPYQVIPQGWNAGPSQLTPPIEYRLTIPNGITVTNTNGGTLAGNVITWTGITYPGTGPGNGVSPPVDWFVNNGVLGGTILTFSFTASPRRFAGGWTPPVTISYRVESIRQPAFQGLNGDIHAGSCPAAGPATGNIRGYASGTSMGEYVIASSATLTGVKSNGTGVDRLKLGSSGGYRCVSRPDLLAAYIAVGGGTPVAGPTFNVTGRGGVFEYSGGGVLNVSGTISQKITLISRNGGTVRIFGPLMIDPAVAALGASTPSMGIIARGGIEIAASVTRVDAYLFSSQGVINTCAESNNSCSTPTLVVNGFLMGQTILFNRLGPLNSNGAQIAERVSLSPQIYLNPPQFFGADADDLLLQGQGEKPPLF